ncbi:hypothetical protein HMPREF1238_1395 [Streptococcus pyogenes GA40377]|nr:hypothetical protein HMPREF1238_1395 [Streptococcus pyogenes GA40377]
MFSYYFSFVIAIMSDKLMTAEGHVTQFGCRPERRYLTNSS